MGGGGGGGGGRTSEEEEHDDGTEFRLVEPLHEILSDNTSGNPPARRTFHNSPPSSTNEGGSIFYGGWAADQTSVTNGKQSYESNDGHEARGHEAEQDRPSLPDKEALALALGRLSFKDRGGEGAAEEEASNLYVCYQTMNNTWAPFALDTLGMQDQPRDKSDKILGLGNPPLFMTNPQMRTEAAMGGERNGRRTEALSSSLSDQRSSFPVYHGASPMDPGTHTHWSPLASIGSRHSLYQHQLPLPDVADSLRASSPYQPPQFFSDAQAPSFMYSGHLLEQQLPNDGYGLLQSGNFMNSAVSPLRYGQSDLSTMGGNPYQCHHWSSCSRKGENFEFPHRLKAYSANDLLDFQASNKFRNHPFPEEVSRSSHGMDPLRYHNRSASFGNDYGRASFNRNRNPCMSDAASIDSKFDSVDSVEGRTYSLAKDQHGCHFLQSKLDKGSPQDVYEIFDEIIDHIVELMTDPFGNKLVQKFLEVCDEKQRLHILHAITREEGELIRISCNKHGTRVVQKLIENLKAPEHISMFANSLNYPGIVSLMKNINGNHVAQHCLKFFPPEFKEFLYTAAIAHCAELAVDRQGCCVLQKCIRHSEGFWKEMILLAICSYSHFLSSNAYGNYAVQYVLEQNIPWATARVLGQLEGSYEELTTQKYGSNVVEKCLCLASQEQLGKVVCILMNSPSFLQIMINPYGNYVIQSALKQCKGALYYALVGAVRSHRRVLCSNQYGKKVLASIKLS